MCGKTGCTVAALHKQSDLYAGMGTIQGYVFLLKLATSDYSFLNEGTNTYEP